MRMPTCSGGRFADGTRRETDKGSEKSFGHLTMAHPALWADRVGEFMRWLEAGSDHRASQNSAPPTRRN